VTMLNDPPLRDSLARSGADPFPSTPEEFRKILSQDIVKWAKVVKAAGLKAE
jgi:tripartite-type tricarboxylate transporter receptor subunit TctC